jgi:hypothetical protein
MRVREVKGYVANPGSQTVRFTISINALDRASATTLAKSMYGKGPEQKVNISSIRDMGASSIKSNQ